MYILIIWLLNIYLVAINSVYYLTVLCCTNQIHWWVKCGSKYVFFYPYSYQTVYFCFDDRTILFYLVIKDTNCGESITEFIYIYILHCQFSHLYFFGEFCTSMKSKRMTLSSCGYIRRYIRRSVILN